MYYRVALNQAMKNTSKMGLASDLTKLGKGYKRQRLEKSCYEVASIISDQYGFYSTSDVRSQCFRVHPIAKKILAELGIKSEVTFGNVVLKGEDWYPNATLDSMTNELLNPGSKESNFDGHCWLTLKDGSIIDFTHYCDRTNPNVPEPWTHNILIIDVSAKYLPDEYHLPFYLGEEFLFKTGCLHALGPDGKPI